MTLLKIVNLTVQVGKKAVLKNINMEVSEGEVIALVGPNAAGKTSLARTIAGFPEYKIVKGQIFFKNEDITELPLEERAKKGVFLVFQEPPAVKNLKLKTFLEYLKLPKEKAKMFLDQIGFHKTILDRELNVAFSGGEKKVSEILQMIALNPDFPIFDELDSGLDARLLYKIVDYILKWIKENNKAALFITHRSDMLNIIKPDDTYVLTENTLICRGDYKIIWDCVKRNGYRACATCNLLTKLTL